MKERQLLTHLLSPQQTRRGPATSVVQGVLWPDQHPQTIPRSSLHLPYLGFMQLLLLSSRRGRK